MIKSLVKWFYFLCTRETISCLMTWIFCDNGEYLLGLRKNVKQFIDLFFFKMSSNWNKRILLFKIKISSQMFNEKTLETISFENSTSKFRFPNADFSQKVSNFLSEFTKNFIQFYLKFPWLPSWLVTISLTVLSIDRKHESNDFSFKISRQFSPFLLLSPLSYPVNKVHFYISYGTWLHIVIKFHNMYSPLR